MALVGRLVAAVQLDARPLRALLLLLVLVVPLMRLFDAVHLARVPRFLQRPAFRRQDALHSGLVLIDNLFHLLEDTGVAVVLQVF